jgi:DUF971 family protein
MGSGPADIKARQADQVIRITWEAGHVGEYGYVDLRNRCECAACKDEWTGARILDPASIPADLSLKDMKLVGHYAVQFSWSDGHDTGLFTWERLRGMCGCERCRGTPT